MSEEIMGGKLPERTLIKRENLASGIRDELKAIPVDVKEADEKVTVNFQGTLISGVEIGEETYKIFNVSGDWTNQTSYHCEDNGDGTWFYYLETIDECIGEMKRLIMYEAKKGKTNSLESEAPKMIGRLLTREQWVNKLEPLMKGTDLEVMPNPTPNEQSVIIRTKGTLSPQHVAIWIKQKKTHVVLGKPTKEMIENEIELPFNPNGEDKFKANQYHYRDRTDQFVMNICFLVAQHHKKK